jgi:hypothetical protein
VSAFMRPAKHTTLTPSRTHLLALMVLVCPPPPPATVQHSPRMCINH